MAANLKELLAKVDALKAQVDAVRPLSVDQEQRIFQKLRLDWNYHSNAIEGNKLTQGETRVFLLEGLTAQGKPLKDHLDIKGHNQVIDFLIEFIHHKAELSEAVIREMHKILLVEPYEAEAITPEGQRTEKWIQLGVYKSTPNQVTTGTGEIRRFALPEETPARMGELMHWLRGETEKRETHPVLIASVLHHEFVAIHPFDDGNGRMGRILMNLILMQYGYPPVVIKTMERDQYFAALGRADQGEREDLIAFIAEKLIGSLDLYLKGARGEPIEESDDIDKKIALLKRGLEHIPEPKIFSPEVYRHFISRDFRLLLGKISQKLSKFDDLFFDYSVSLHTGSNISQFRNSGRTEIISRVMETLQSPTFPGQNDFFGFQIFFAWETFKKGGTKLFNHTAILQIVFDKLTYQIHIQDGKSLSQLHGMDLSEADCNGIANELAERFLQRIQQYLKAS